MSMSTHVVGFCPPDEEWQASNKNHIADEINNQKKLRALLYSPPPFVALWNFAWFIYLWLRVFDALGK